jgi:hypothetical protein
MPCTEQGRPAWILLTGLALAVGLPACHGTTTTATDGGADSAGCSGTEEMCAGACVSLEGDPDHCGGCGQACPSSEVCGGGICLQQCAPGTIVCGRSCVNTGTDVRNCGTCGNSCAEGAECLAGGCQTRWHCELDSRGNTVCTMDQAPMPGSGSWLCADVDDETQCVAAADEPATNEEWTCSSDEAGRRRCHKARDLPPESMASGPWMCWLSKPSQRVCTNEAPVGESCPPGSNQRRWCEETIYGTWGQQVCSSEGAWGNCEMLEVGVRPATFCACYFPFFHQQCCERPDCVMTAEPGAPGCPPKTGLLCDYCDRLEGTSCSGGGICVLLNSTWENYCGQDCSASNCPTGYTCRSVMVPPGTTYRQCIPDDYSCYLPAF